MSMPPTATRRTRPGIDGCDVRNASRNWRRAPTRSPASKLATTPSNRSHREASSHASAGTWVPCPARVTRARGGPNDSHALFCPGVEDSSVVRLSIEATSNTAPPTSSEVLAGSHRHHRTRDEMSWPTRGGVARTTAPGRPCAGGVCPGDRTGARWDPCRPLTPPTVVVPDDRRRGCSSRHELAQGRR